MKQEDLTSLWRILDANLNRVAEALRVVEDVCRFHWDLGGLAAQLKALRHSVLGAVHGRVSSPSPLLAARDVAGDAGRQNASPGAASDLRQVALRNLQRGKEALRVLEEAARIALPEACPVLEEARYQMYSVEKGVGHLCSVQDRTQRLVRARLCLLATAARARGSLEAVVEAAIRGGAMVVQLREKGLEDADLLRSARRLRELTAAHGALLIVNDRPDIALLSHADGVHLGQSDLSVRAARRILEPGMLVGISTHSEEQALRAERDGADYVGVGPVFQTPTKDAGPPLGPTLAGQIAARVRIPAWAIGGICADNLAPLVRAGIAHVAVSSAVLDASDPGQAAASLARALEPMDDCPDEREARPGGVHGDDHPNG
jgi:thiamine-phosphate pyrophosphorylase